MITTGKQMCRLPYIHINYFLVNLFAGFGVTNAV